MWLMLCFSLFHRVMRRSTISTIYLDFYSPSKCPWNCPLRIFVYSIFFFLLFHSHFDTCLFLDLDKFVSSFSLLFILEFLVFIVTSFAVWHFWEQLRFKGFYSISEHTQKHTQIISERDWQRFSCLLWKKTSQLSRSLGRSIFSLAFDTRDSEKMKKTIRYDFDKSLIMLFWLDRATELNVDDFALAAFFSIVWKYKVLFTITDLALER